MVASDYILLIFIFKVSQSYPTVMKFQPNFQLAKQNWADSKIKVNKF